MPDEKPKEHTGYRVVIKCREDGHDIIQRFGEKPEFNLNMYEFAPFVEWAINKLHAKGFKLACEGGPIDDPATSGGVSRTRLLLTTQL